MSVARPTTEDLGRWNREEERAGIGVLQRSFGFGNPDAAHSVLLLHGAGGSPADYLDLGNALADAGFRGLCPLLPGHGADPLTLAGSRFPELLDRGLEAFDSLASAPAPVFIVAQSLGAVLAARIANVRKIPGLVALAPALRPFVARRAGLLAAGLIVQPRLAWKTLQWQLHLLREIRATRGELPGVTCPVLVMVSQDDPTVSPRGAREFHDGVSSTDRSLREFPDQGHVLSASPDRRRRVFPPILEFLLRLSSRETESRTTGPPPAGA
jgi:carboxylesterase